MDVSELQTLAARVGEALLARGWQLATAESCTGGWAAQTVTAISGSSAWFDRGFVTYSNEAKQEMLDVRSATLASHGAVSEAVVREMAEGVLAHSRAHVALAISGIAGPTGGTAEKPVGMVCIAWSLRSGARLSQTLYFQGDRAEVRRQSVVAALHGVLHLIESDTAQA